MLPVLMQMVRRVQMHPHRTWLWVAMLLVHLPALAGDWGALLLPHGTGLHAGSFIALNLSALFFVLKIRDVRWLQFSSDRRSLVTLIIAVALLHVNLTAEPGQTVSYADRCQVAATLLLVVSLTPVQTLLANWLSGALAGRHRPRRGPHRTAAVTTCRSALPRLLRSPRAPPLSC